MVSVMVSHKRKNPPNPVIARRLRAMLKWHGVTDAEFARRIGMTPGAVSQILSGQSQPLYRNVQKAALEFDEDAGYLMGHKDRGSKGFGAAWSSLMEELTGDEMHMLDQISPDLLHKWLGEMSLWLPRHQRKSLQEVKDHPKKD